MKKLFILLALVQCLVVFGQIENKAIPGGGSCISGPLTIYVGQTVTFTSVNDAQCSQCYDWDINDDSTSSDNSIVGNLQIIGSDINKTVSIKALSIGTGKICLTYFTESGCNSCCINVTIVESQNCCAPTLDGWFECRGSGPNTGGQLLINDNPSCPVDWSSISSIDIWINGANFIGVYSGDTLTLSGPFTGPLGFTVMDSIQECYYGNNFGAIVTFHYNNGCPAVQVGGTWYDYNTPQFNKQDVNQIKVYPNPTNSTVEFKGIDLEKYNISIYDINGKVIINKSKINGKINLTGQPRGIYIYRIEEKGKVIQEGKINKQ